MNGLDERSFKDRRGLFDGVMPVAEEAPVRDNEHAGTTYFRQAR